MILVDSIKTTFSGLAVRKEKEVVEEEGATLDKCTTKFILILVDSIKTTFSGLAVSKEKVVVEEEGRRKRIGLLPLEFEY